jgi:hypothetical protein
VPTKRRALAGHADGILWTEALANEIEELLRAFDDDPHGFEIIAMNDDRWKFTRFRMANCAETIAQIACGALKRGSRQSLLEVVGVKELSLVHECHAFNINDSVLRRNGAIEACLNVCDRTNPATKLAQSLQVGFTGFGALLAEVQSAVR